jgi:hypothetical protein
MKKRNCTCRGVDKAEPERATNRDITEPERATNRDITEGVLVSTFIRWATRKETARAGAV